MLDRTRAVRTTALLPLARGILEPAPAEARDDADDDDAKEEEVVVAAAARCAPSLAIMREREMRGFRVGCCSCPVVDDGDEGDAGPPRLPVDEEPAKVTLAVAGDCSRRLWVPLWGVVVEEAAASAVAAAAREVGLTGGGMTACFCFLFWLGDDMSGVVNIFPGRGELAFAFALRGLFVIGSRITLRGGVLERCAMMVLVLDLTTAPGAAGVLRVFARELAVGANSLDVVVLFGLKMVSLLLLPLAPSAVPVPEANVVDVDERETPMLAFFMPTLDDVALLARKL